MQIRLDAFNVGLLQGIGKVMIVVNMYDRIFVEVGNRQERKI